MTNERNNQKQRPRNKGQQQRLTSGSHAPTPRNAFHNPAMAEGLQALMRQSFAVNVICITLYFAIII